MIRIITGWGNPGGSSTALSNLCLAFNKFGYECILYAPHDWILSKCKSEKLTSNKLQISPDDILIFHFWRLEKRPPVKKVLLSCHEQDVFPLQNINFKIFDKIHFVSEHQIQYHKITYPHFVIPNVLDDLKSNPKKNSKVAGIIGSVDRNKQNHISIERALSDGFDDIRLFGNITDLKYWDEKVKGLVDGVKVKYCGLMEDKQEMYDQITDVYFSSINECRPYVIAECEITNTKVHALPNKNYMNQKFVYSQMEIIDMWKKELEL